MNAVGNDMLKHRIYQVFIDNILMTAVVEIVSDAFQKAYFAADFSSTQFRGRLV
jgi:hypothetical protein